MITTNLKSKKDLTLNEINFLLNEEDDLKTYKKLQYFKFKIMGFSKIESCELSGINEDSRYYLENLWDKGGYNALIPHYGGGRKSKLKENELKELTEILQKDDSWLIKDVEKLIKSKYDVEYGYHGVRNLLIKLNIPIANHFEVERENKNNVVNNINNLSDDAISEINKISQCCQFD